MYFCLAVLDDSTTSANSGSSTDDSCTQQAVTSASSTQQAVTPASSTQEVATSTPGTTPAASTSTATQPDYSFPAPLRSIENLSIHEQRISNCDISKSQETDVSELEGAVGGFSAGGGATATTSMQVPPEFLGDSIQTEVGSVNVFLIQKSMVVLLVCFLHVFTGC